MHSKRRLFVLLVAVVATFGAITISLAQEGEVGSVARPFGDHALQPLIEGPRSGSSAGAGIGIPQPRPMRNSASTGKVLRLSPLSWPRRI